MEYPKFNKEALREIYAWNLKEDVAYRDPTRSDVDSASLERNTDDADDIDDSGDLLSQVTYSPAGQPTLAS